MPRPVKPRFVSEVPIADAYVPRGTPAAGEVSLSLEGMEALRLSDFEGLAQDRAAERMGVSRQTYGRILAAARHTVAHALVTGKKLRIRGGCYALRNGHRRRHRGGRRPANET
jgi:predicted DNA-binding protein (UPF0251 family)